MLRAKVADAEAKVEEFRSKTNLFIGTNNTSLSNQTLGESNRDLAAARSQKAELEAKAKFIRDMLKSGGAVESSDMVNSAVIGRLNEQRVTLRAQLAEQSSTLLDNHPRIKELKAQIGDLDRQIRDEAQRLARSLENDARIAGSRVESLSASLDQLKRAAASTNGEDVQLRALEREAKSQRDLLESYLAKYRETASRDSLGAVPSDARIISKAAVSNTPYFPKKLPIVLIATSRPCSSRPASSPPASCSAATSIAARRWRRRPRSSRASIAAPVVVARARRADRARACGEEKLAAVVPARQEARG